MADQEKYITIETGMRRRRIPADKLDWALKQGEKQAEMARKAGLPEEDVQMYTVKIVKEE